MRTARMKTIYTMSSFFRTMAFGTGTAGCGAEPLRAVRTDGDLTALERRAELGDTDACMELYRMYGTGDGVAKDQLAALKYLKVCAAAGDAAAMRTAGRMQLMGKGNVPKDREQAEAWLAQAAALGDGEAMYLLGRDRKSVV